MKSKPTKTKDRHSKLVYVLMSTLHNPFGTQKIRKRNINENKKKEKANGSRYAVLIHFILP